MDIKSIAKVEIEDHHTMRATYEITLRLENGAVLARMPVKKSSAGGLQIQSIIKLAIAEWDRWHNG